MSTGRVLASLLVATILAAACSSGGYRRGVYTGVHVGSPWWGYGGYPYPVYVGDGGYPDGPDLPPENLPSPPPEAVPLPEMGMPDMGGYDYGGFDDF